MSVTATMIANFGPWLWLVGGFLLLAIELVAPGTVFLWFGLAALGTGLIAVLFGPGWQIQVMLFAALAGASLWFWWRLRRSSAATPHESLLNERAQRHVGRRFALAEPIVGGSGRVKIDDTMWRITGPDLPAGTDVRVTSTDGATLTVEPAP